MFDFYRESCNLVHSLQAAQDQLPFILKHIPDDSLLIVVRVHDLLCEFCELFKRSDELIKAFESELAVDLLI